MILSVAKVLAMCSTAAARVVLARAYRTLPAVLCLAAAGCGSSSGPSLPRPFPTAAPASATATASVDPAGGTITFPTAGGYSGAFVYSVNDAAAPVSAALSTSTFPIAQLVSSPPPGTSRAAFEFKLAQAVKFSDWHGLLTTITVPAGLITSGRSFYEYGYDLTTGVAIGYNPGTVSGSTITFAVSSSAVTLQDHEFLLVLTSLN